MMADTMKENNANWVHFMTESGASCAKKAKGGFA
jgi:hypothetical protein